MSNDLFAQLAQQQWILCLLPSPLCTSERWKLLSHIRMMVWQPSASLRHLIAGWNNPASQLLLKGKCFGTCRDPQGSPGAEMITSLHRVMHLVIAFLPHLQSSSSAANKLTHHNGVMVWLWNFCRGEWIPMDLLSWACPRQLSSQYYINAKPKDCCCLEHRLPLVAR